MGGQKSENNPKIINRKLDPNEGIIEYIHRGGEGEEAVVSVELRTVIPGVRQVIKTEQGVVTAVRREKSPEPGLGLRMFLKNMLVKKMDDYFTWSGIYRFSHVARAFGSISTAGENPCEACIYEWFPGEEGFPWRVTDLNHKLQDVVLHDWDVFTSKFEEAGVRISEDVFYFRNRNISKNIVHQFPFLDTERRHLNVVWKRIDFGERSLAIEHEDCETFLQDNSYSMKEMLRSERYDMLVLTNRYLADKSLLSEGDLSLLTNYIQDYRIKSVDHYISHGTSLGGQLFHLDTNEDTMQYL